MMDRALRAPRPLAGKLVGAIGSVVVHIGLLAAAAYSMRLSPPQHPEVLYDVDVVSLGAVEGAIDGAGTPKVEPTAQARPPAPPPAPEPPRPEPPEPQPAAAPVLTAPSARERAPEGHEAAAPTPAQAASAKPDEASKEAEREAMREAVRKAMLAPGEPASPVAGAGTAAPQGAPDGVAGAKPKPRVSSRYASMLDGWFSSRVSLRGLDLPWDELKLLHATVTITLSPDRHVTGFSMVSGSGNGAYDARVQSSMQAVVASGATLPAPPEDEDVPPSITLVFRCRSQERCS